MPIRKAQLTDAKSISQLLINASDQFFREDFSAAGLAKFKADFAEGKIRERLVDAAFSYYVTEEDDEIIAVCAIRNGAHLYNLFTRADYHRQGVAKALWQYVIAELLQHGISKVTVNTSNYAVPAYEKLGFVRVGERQVFEGIPFNPMVCEINA